LSFSIQKLTDAPLQLQLKSGKYKISKIKLKSFSLLSPARSETKEDQNKSLFCDFSLSSLRSQFPSRDEYPTKKKKQRRKSCKIFCLDDQVFANGFLKIANETGWNVRHAFINQHFTL